MNKYFLLSIFVLVLPSALYSEPVDFETAKQQAVDFLSHHSSLHGKRVSAANKQLQLLHVQQQSPDEAPLLYVFGEENGEGYVLITGDDCAVNPVLGYSITGKFEADNMPENLRYWLEEYGNQIAFARNSSVSLRSTRQSAPKEQVSPLVTSEWDQWAPYNSQCPIVWESQAPTGCVATAMAQIMYHYQWPQQTRKPIPGYPIYDVNVTISDIPVTTIDWDNMLPKYDIDGSYPAEQVDAIAQLMQLCGTSVRMHYDSFESAATMPRVIKAFPRYFGYSPDISIAYAADYDSNDWNQLIYDEMAASRPVIYCGSGDGGGHSFIVDGYDDNDYFHINWGWNGSDNGYFLLSVLPDFNTDQCAVVGIQPSTTSIPDAYGVLENGTMTLYYDTEKNTRPGQVFDDLVSYDFFDYQPLETEILRCPPEESMTNCIIDPSFANYDLETLYCFFSQCKNLKSVTGLDNLNTLHVENLGGMFYGCPLLETIDFEDFRTGNVTDMGWMFRDCISLKDLDLSGFNTENVFSFEGMFIGCSSLENIDFTGFNVEKTQFMDWMFENCSSLKSLDLSSFNTKSLLTMYSMFEGCSSLTDLDISNFQTDNVIDMAYTFRYCSSLKNIDLSHFNTQEVEQMTAMFEGCTLLESLDLSSFNTEKVEVMYDMFRECSSLKTIDVRSFNTSNVVNMERMFSECTSLEELDLSSFNTEKVTNMFNLFYHCNALKHLDISSFNTSNVTNMWGMFDACCSLESLDLSNFNTENVTNMYAMFQYCPLKVLDLSSFNTSKVTNMDRLLFQSMELKTIYVGDSWNTDNVEGGEPFYGCEKLVGGKGTTFDWDHIGVDYARVDGGPDNPGYLTFKPAGTSAGDVNNDGEVDLSDAIMVTYYSLHEVPSNFNAAAADMNGDGEIDLSDAIIIIYISLGVR